MRDAAIAGLGLAAPPLFIVFDALRSGEPVRVLPDEELPADTIYALYPPVKLLPRRVRALIDQLAAALAEAPPWQAASGEARPEPRRRSSG